ncbi:dienelactone hydrolase family protein [Sphingomonas sp. BIUV-7]|uniref:Dienelactone hydrolase family protein n=1 Tax=Sphingomonas natans TaxID=3063330 RepID=A0ABT8YBB6_9SPHN|nr:dienelactone hydrolase family protein [Sphingomonas sp. BIUV-7]MDO6415287.1 dienelactone hydrolase family protein [Sphingomonas sp. BIUV-7]
MSNSLIIFLHGVGSQGADLGALAGQWRRLLPDSHFVAPDGPAPFDMGPAGHQWFSVNGVTRANRADRIVSARAAFDATLSAIITRHGFEGRLDRIAFVGFSQGSIMALDAVVSGRWPVAGIVAFSGRLATSAERHPHVPTQILMVHGAEDAIIGVEEAREARDALTRHGISVRLHELPALGHSISSAGATMACQFLTDLLIPKPD